MKGQGIAIAALAGLGLLALSKGKAGAATLPTGVAMVAPEAATPTVLPQEVLDSLPAVVQAAVQAAIQAAVSPAAAIPTIPTVAPIPAFSTSGSISFEIYIDERGLTEPRVRFNLTGNRTSFSIACINSLDESSSLQNYCINGPASGTFDFYNWGVYLSVYVNEKPNQCLWLPGDAATGGWIKKWSYSTLATGG